MTEMPPARAILKSAIHANPGKSGKELSEITGIGRGSIASYLGRMIRDCEIKGEATEDGTVGYRAVRKGREPSETDEITIKKGNPQLAEIREKHKPKEREKEAEEPAGYDNQSAITFKSRAPIMVVSPETTIAAIMESAENNGVSAGSRFDIELDGKRIKCRMPK